MQRRFLLAGAAGVAVSLVGLLFDVRQFLQSYLMAYLLCLGVTLGSLALGMVHQLSGGAWGVVLRRPIGAASRVLPGVGPIYMSQSTGDSDYHGLQVWVNRRFAEGLAFQVAYTWSHAITNVPLQSFTAATT